MVEDNELKKFVKELCTDAIGVIRESVYSSDRVKKERRLIDLIESKKHLIEGEIMEETKDFSASKITTKTTAEELRALGFRVKFFHKRIFMPDIKKWKRLYEIDATHKTYVVVNNLGNYRTVPHKSTVMRSIGEAIQEYGEKPKVYENGGYCRVEVTAPDGTIFEGETTCSVLDHYNKRLARHIALGRAVENMVQNWSNKNEEE